MAKKCAADSNKIQSQLSVGETFSTPNMEDNQDNKDEDENYFSLLDMFVCTRWDYYSKIFQTLNLIHLLETFSSPSARVLGSRRTSSG